MTTTAATYSPAQQRIIELLGFASPNSASTVVTGADAEVVVPDDPTDADRHVDRRLDIWVREAADGMGLSARRRVWTVELPLAMPAYVVAYAYTDYLQFSGPLQSWLRATFGLQGRVIPTSSACTSGSQGIGYAYEAIRFGRRPAVVSVVSRGSGSGR